MSNFMHWNGYRWDTKSSYYTLCWSKMQNCIWVVSPVQSWFIHDPLRWTSICREKEIWHSRDVEAKSREGYELGWCENLLLLPMKLLFQQQSKLIFTLELPNCHDTMDTWTHLTICFYFCFADCGVNCHKQCRELLVLACRKLIHSGSLGSVSPVRGTHSSLPSSPTLPACQGHF